MASHFNAYQCIPHLTMRRQIMVVMHYVVWVEDADDDDANYDVDDDMVLASGMPPALA